MGRQNPQTWTLAAASASPASRVCPGSPDGSGDVSIRSGRDGLGRRSVARGDRAGSRRRRPRCSRRRPRPLRRPCRRSAEICSRSATTSACGRVAHTRSPPRGTGSVRGWSWRPVGVDRKEAARPRGNVAMNASAYAQPEVRERLLPEWLRTCEVIASSIMSRSAASGWWNLPSRGRKVALGSPAARSWPPLNSITWSER
jgi:hypothetical protein